MFPLTAKAYGAILGRVREVGFRATFQTSHGDFELDDRDFVSGSISLGHSSLSGSGFELGACVSSSFSCSLINEAEKWSDIALEGATIRPIARIPTDEGVTEIPLGVFIVDQPVRPYGVFEIRAADRLILLDEPLAKCGISYPLTNVQALQKIAQACKIPLAASASTILNGTHVIKAPPKSEMSARDAVGEIALMAGGFAAMTRDGQLEIRTYQKADVLAQRLTWGQARHAGKKWKDYKGATWKSLNSFIKRATYALAKGQKLTWKGAKDSQYTWGWLRHNGLQTSMDTGIWELPIGSRYSFSQLTDPITITGMHYKDKAWGTDDYALEIEPMEFLPGPNLSALDAVWEKIKGLSYCAYSADIPGNPAMDCGDVVHHSTVNGKSIYSYVTEIRYKHGGKSKIGAKAKPKSQLNYKSANARRLSSVSAKVDETNQALSAYQLETAQMSDTLSQALGVYQTVETQADGSVITYLHSAKELSASPERWRIAKSATGVPEMRYTSDGGKTWSAGVLGDKLIMRSIVAQSITSEHLAAGAVTADKISAGAITADKIAAKSLTSEQINVAEIFGTNATFSGTIEAATIKASTILMSDGNNYFSVGQGGATASTNMVANNMVANNMQAYGGSMQNISANNFTLGSGAIYDGVVIGGNILVSQTGIRLNCGYGRVAVFENTGNAWLGIYNGDPNIPGNMIWAVTQTGQVYGSDKRLKDDIEKLEPDRVLAFLNSIDVCTWNWKRDGSKGIGVIADEIQNAGDDELSALLVSEINGYKGVHYDLLATMAIGAVNALSEQVKDLSARLERLENGK